LEGGSRNSFKLFPDLRFAIEVPQNNNRGPGIGTLGLRPTAFGDATSTDRLSLLRQEFIHKTLFGKCCTLLFLKVNFLK
jgi:hypothetical protein